MPNHAKLRELATKIAGDDLRYGGWSVAHCQYIAAASPMRVLELLDELASATAEVERLIAQLSDTRDG